MNDRFPPLLAVEQDRVAAGDPEEWSAVDFVETEVLARLRLGGVVLEVRGGEAELGGILSTRWHAFRDDAAIDACLSLRAVDHLPFETPVAYLARDQRDDQYLLKLRGVIARFDVASRTGAAIVERHLGEPRLAEQNLVNLLRLALWAFAPASDRYLVHAAAIEVAGGVALIVGQAQSGKSTVARLAGERQVLTDDAVVVSVDSGRVFVETAGFWGSEGSAGIQRSMTRCRRPVVAIVSLVKASENRIRPLSPAMATIELSCVVSLVATDTAARAESLAAMESVARRCPVFELEFSHRDGSFWDLIDAAAQDSGGFSSPDP